MKTLGWFCAFAPVIGLLLFWLSVYLKIQTNWNFLHDPHDPVFDLTCDSIAALLVAPVFYLGFKYLHEDHLIFTAALFIPGFFLLVGAVMRWTMILTGIMNPNIEPIVQTEHLKVIPFCIASTTIVLIMCYGSTIVCLAVKRVVRNDFLNKPNNPKTC